MALNFQQVFEKIREIGLGARARQESQDARREQARSLLEAWADKAPELRNKLERARQADPSLRCAIPLDEPLNFHSLPGPASTGQVTLIAADGSQIVPDRHAAVLFGLINVGAIVLSGGPAEAPQVTTDSQLSFDDEVVNWTDGLVALRRDLAERKKLLALSKEYSSPLVTLTDGPLQLWEARESNEVLGYEKALEEYLVVLSQLQEHGAITAGYVDKPSSNLLVRLLEVADHSRKGTDQPPRPAPLARSHRSLAVRPIAPTRGTVGNICLAGPFQSSLRRLAGIAFLLPQCRPGRPSEIGQDRNTGLGVPR